MTQPQYPDEDLAYHEAGHTVAALVLGRNVERVSIVRDDPGRGVRVPSFNDDRPETPDAVRDKILVLLAGNAAQQVRNPAGRRQPDARDWPQAQALAGDAASLDAEWERALALLQTPEHWQQVDRIAQALLRERVLQRAQIAELMDGAP